jgi:hypothetical protein
MTLLTTHDLTIQFSIPQFVGARSDKYQLLTVGGVLVSGPWRGYLGEFYLGWAPLPKANRNCRMYLQSLSEAAKAQIGQITPCHNGVTVTYLDGSKVTFTDD